MIDKKALRKQFGGLGWALILYTVIMNVAVLLTMLVQLIPAVIQNVINGGSGVDQAVLDSILSSGWGYLIAISVGLLLLRLWKGKQFCRQTMWTRGKPMHFKDFLCLLCLMVSGQLVFQVLATIQEAILNVLGLSALQAIETATGMGETFSLFLYIGILGPIAEELLFRGLVLRTLEPYGKRFAILLSAFLFAIFHGNVVQTPYAFCMGLVLGYAAIEYSMAWAMVLHMFNNLVLADMMGRLTASMAADAAISIQWSVILLFSIGAIVTAIRYRREIRQFILENKVNNQYVACFFRSGGIITLILVSMIGIVLSISII